MTSESLAAVIGRPRRDVRLRDGTQIVIRLLEASDCAALQDYLAEVPANEQDFLRQDLSVIVERWCEEQGFDYVLPFVACAGRKIVGDAALYRDPGVWAARVGKLRLFVHPDRRGRGVGRGLVSEIVDTSRRLLLDKLVAECAGGQDGLIAFLRRNGFAEAVRLPEFLRDRRGRRHDLVWMVHALDRVPAEDSSRPAVSVTSVAPSLGRA